jgi:hypothetical protein
MATAEHREPCDSRGSCTVLGAPGGEIPSGDSTRSARFFRKHAQGPKVRCWIRVAGHQELARPISQLGRTDTLSAAAVNDRNRRVLVIPESRAERLLSPIAATRWRKKSGASKVSRALALLTQRGRPCSRRCLHPQSSAIVRRRPGLQDGYQNGWDRTLLSHLAGLFGEFGVDGRNLPLALSPLRTSFSGGKRGKVRGDDKGRSRR